MFDTMAIGRALAEKVPENIRKNVEELHKKIMQDADIVEFIKQNEPIMTDDFIKSNFTKFMEYVKIRDYDKHFTARMRIYANMVIVENVPRNEEVQLRIKKGIVTSTKFDSITSAHKGVTSSRYVIDTGNAKALSFIKEFVEGYNISKLNQSMWLCGQFGVGKSYLMGALVTSLKRRGIGVCFYDFNQLLTDLRTSMGYDTKIKDERLKELKECEVLILDDMGSEKISEWSIKEVLHNTLNARYADKKTTFFTSNLTKDEYCEKLLETRADGLDEMDVQRLRQRLDSVAVEIQMYGEDKRPKADLLYKQAMEKKIATADSVMGD